MCIPSPQKVLAVKNCGNDQKQINRLSWAELDKLNNSKSILNQKHRSDFRDKNCLQSSDIDKGHASQSPFLLNRNNNSNISRLMKTDQKSKHFMQIAKSERNPV
jgi:hypothetical protein